MIHEDRGTLVKGLLAGLAAAVAGGVVWGLIVKWSEYEVGFVAWGIGFLAGIAVLTAAGGRRGLPLQAIAIVSALVGILIGKYLSFVWALEDVIGAQFADEVDIPIFSWDTVDVFREDLDAVFGWIDLLWAGLAVVTAWRALAPEQELATEPVAEATDRPPPAP